MVNINKSGDSLLITSYNNSQFPWSEGELSVPLNSVYFILEKDTDFLVFRSIYNDEKLFTALIDEIQINGQQATRDNIVQLFDSVANTIVSGDGTIIAGVESLNGLSGALNIKSINGQSLLGTGDITIEGGSGGTTEETDPIFTEWLSDNNTIVAGVYGDTGLNSITVEDLEGNTNNVPFKTINGNTIVGEGNITIEGGSGGTTEETDPIFTEWLSDNNTIVAGVYGDTGLNSITVEDLEGNTNNVPFKTINGNTIVGEGNITIEGGSGGADMSNYYDKTESDERFAPKQDVDYLNQWQNQYSSDVESIRDISSKLDEVEQKANDNDSDIDSLQTDISYLIKDVVVNDANDGALEVTNGNYSTNTYYCAKINGKPVLSQTTNESYKIPDTSNYYTKTEIDALIGQINDKITEINNLV